MARRKNGRPFQFSRIPRQQIAKTLPIWTSTQTDIVNLAVQALLSKFGITDVPSYFRQLRVPIAISVVVCASFGASSYGIKGFVVGGLLGLVAPVALVWLAVLLVGIAIFLGIYCLAWAAIWAIFRWFLAG